MLCSAFTRTVGPSGRRLARFNTPYVALLCNVAAVQAKPRPAAPRPRALHYSTMLFRVPAPQPRGTRAPLTSFLAKPYPGALVPFPDSDGSGIADSDVRVQCSN